MHHRLLLLPVALLCLTACGSDSSSPTQPNQPLEHGTMTAVVDGQAWTANVSLQVAYQNGALGIAGVAGDKSALGLGLVPVTGPGTYPIGATSPTNGSYTVGGTTAVWQAAAGVGGTGTVVLTSLTDTSASGTFSFELPPITSTGATGTKSITEGKFDLTF